jgi:hypothetical protein
MSKKKPESSLPYTATPTRYIKVDHGRYVYGVYVMYSAQILGVADTLEEAMLANNMSTETAPDLREAYRK